MLVRLQAGAYLAVHDTDAFFSMSRCSRGVAGSVDLVTEWDVRVEEFVRSEIAKAHPTFKLYVRLY